MTRVELDLRQLTTFVAVAETLHFGRAARRLHLAQPAVSQQVRRLEATLGAPLFVRDRRSTALTATGEAFLPAARRTLTAAQEAVDTARAAARGDTGRLRVGIAPSAAATAVLAAVRELLDATPQLVVEVRELRQRDLVDALRHGELDLAVGAVLHLPPRDTGISWSTVAEEAFVLAVPAGHRLGRESGAVRLSDVDDEPVVSFARDDGPRYDDALRGLLAAARVVPSREAVVRERSTQLALVAAGLGVALVPAGTAALRPGDITYRPLRDDGPVLTTIAAWRTTDDNPVLVRALRHVHGRSDDGASGRRPNAKALP